MYLDTLGAEWAINDRGAAGGLSVMRGQGKELKGILHVSPTCNGARRVGCATTI